MFTRVYPKKKGQPGYEAWMTFIHCHAAVAISLKPEGNLENFFQLEANRRLPQMFSWLDKASGNLFVTVKGDNPDDLSWVITEIKNIKNQVDRVQYHYCIKTQPEGRFEHGVLQFTVASATPFARDYSLVTASAVRSTGEKMVEIKPMYLHQQSGEVLVGNWNEIDRIPDPATKVAAKKAVAKVQEMLSKANWQKELEGHETFHIEIPGYNAPAPIEKPAPEPMITVTTLATDEVAMVTTDEPDPEEIIVATPKAKAKGKKIPLTNAKGRGVKIPARTSRKHTKQELAQLTR
ncbi:MAG: hypothetical protein WCW02_03095 [Candidatus Buchananbacteria bacterium]